VQNAGPATPAAGETPAVPRGPIPYDRHEAVLNKAREDARVAQEAAIASARAEVAKSYGIDASVDPTQVQRQLQIIAAMRQNPVAFLQQMATEIQQDPHYSQVMRSWAGQALATGRADGQAADPMPEADIPVEGGYKLYSEQQMSKLREWDRRQILAAVRADIAPLQQTVQSFEEIRQTAEAQRDAKSWSEKAFGAVSKLPGFTENQTAIAAKMQAFAWPDGVSLAEGRALMHMALMDAYNEIVLPQLTELGRKKAVADLDKRARASTPSPQSNGVGTPSNKEKDGSGFATRLAERMSRT